MDLKSKNGTQVNGVQVVEAPLKDGDRILLGKFELTFGKALEGKVVLDEAKPLSEEAGTIIRRVGELSRLLTGSGPSKTAPDARKAPDVQEIEKSNRILKVLTQVAETLIAVRPVEEVLHQVMDIVFDHVPADRGFLMLEDEAVADKLVPMVVKHRSSGGERGPHHDLEDDHRPRDARTASRSSPPTRWSTRASARGTRSASTASGARCARRSGTRTR